MWKKLATAFDRASLLTHLPLATNLTTLHHLLCTSKCQENFSSQGSLKNRIRAAEKGRKSNLLWTNYNIHERSVSRRQQQLLQSYKGHELKSAYTSWFSLTYVYTGLLTPHTTLHCRTRSHCKYFWWYPFFAIRKFFGIAWNFWSCTFLCIVNVDFD